MHPEIFYSMVGGRPQRRRFLDPRLLLYRNQLVDVLYAGQLSDLLLNRWIGAAGRYP